jgi:hypothetical protein
LRRRHRTLHLKPGIAIVESVAQRASFHPPRAQEIAMKIKSKVRAGRDCGSSDVFI